MDRVERWIFRAGERRWNPLRLWLAVAITVFPVLAGWACSNRAAEKKETGAVRKPLSIQAARVEVQSYRRTVESVGSLFPDEEVTVSSEVEGRVEQVLADVGDRVAPGQPVAEIPAGALGARVHASIGGTVRTVDGSVVIESE